MADNVARVVEEGSGGAGAHWSVDHDGGDGTLYSMVCRCDTGQDHTADGGDPSAYAVPQSRETGG